jgi:transmembrane sensor
MAEHKHTFTSKHEAAAAEWLARRDRGLSASEQAAYMEWLAADPAHAPAIQHLERVWRMCDRLEEWRPSHSAQPNPDLLAPRRTWPRLLAASLGATAIAAVLILSFLLPAPVANPEKPPQGGEWAASSQQAQTRVITGAHGNQRLEDGSSIEIRSDTILEVDFSQTRRHVHLVRGEAFFTVAHDASRPFVVEAAGVTIRSLGTAFSVGLDQFDVLVEVTEGSVEVREDALPKEPETIPGMVLAAGEKAVLRYKRLIPFDELPAYRERTRPKD